MACNLILLIVISIIFLLTMISYCYPAIKNFIQNEKDAIHKYQIYNNRLFETVVYIHEMTECDGLISYYKAVLYENTGKKRVFRDCVKTNKEDLIPLAENMLLEYLVKETKEEIKQKTFEKMLDNYISQ